MLWSGVGEGALETHTHNHESQQAAVRGRKDRSASAGDTVPASSAERTIVGLQRVAGNQAVARLLVQRKPADIDKTDTLNYDNTGRFTNLPAARASGPTRTKSINAALSRSWVQPNQQLIGGHLFGAAFGGPDNDTNVVPWSPTAEGSYSVVEKDFKTQADNDAQQAALSHNPFVASVRTQATFVDRPDLKVDDAELGNGGWPTGPDRTARIDKFNDIADKFSGIPTSVTVTVSGLSTGNKTFTPSATDISPTYTRNPDALKQSFVETVRFKRNATESRQLVKMPDWTAFRKAKSKSPSDLAISKKLGHIAGRHGGQWGVTTSNSPDNLTVLESKIETFIKNASNEQIEGVYVLNKVDVLHYVDHSTKMWACTEPDGTLVASFTLSTGQYNILIAKGTVG
jgi:hypothetical protein